MGDRGCRHEAGRHAFGLCRFEDRLVRLPSGVHADHAVVRLDAGAMAVPAAAESVTRELAEYVRTSPVTGIRSMQSLPAKPPAFMLARVSG